MRRQIVTTLAGTVAATGVILLGFTGTADAAGCGVDPSNHRLYCGNSAPTYVRSTPSSASSAVDVLRSTYSFFLCWNTGDLHSGGNRTWYNTVGDDNKARGYVAAAYVYTSASFDANPSAYGLPHC